MRIEKNSNDITYSIGGYITLLTQKYHFYLESKGLMRKLYFFLPLAILFWWNSIE